jgi:hypothetical protein
MVNYIGTIFLLIRFAKILYMKKWLLFFLFFVYSIGLNAQFDKKNQPIQLQLKTPSIPQNNSTLPPPSIQFKSILDNKESSYIKKYTFFDNKEKPQSILETKNDFKNPGDEIRDKLNHKKSDRAIDDSFKKNQFLGQFESNAKYIKLVCRDHEYPDGDKVRILINDKVVIAEILLETASKEYYLDLSVGFNKIEFEALNQGSSGPNTAAFKVFDDKGTLITSNEWNLTTGVKASIIIVNETKK